MPKHRFSHFSGDEGSSTEWEGFDPLFYGFSRGWGTWFMGEITGEYLLFNSNMDAHMVHISAAPRESIGIGAIYYSFDLDEPEAGISNPAGIGANSDHFADEINLYTDLQITDQVSLSGVYAVAFPGAAAKDVFGDDEDYHLFEIYTTISF